MQTKCSFGNAAKKTNEAELVTKANKINSHTNHVEKLPQINETQNEIMEFILENDVQYKKNNNNK